MDRENLGVDVDRAWLCDGNGDLELVKYEDNIAQAVYNRVSCTKGALDWIYKDYGSEIHNYLGKPNTPGIRDEIQKEIESQVRKDIRLTEAKVDILYYTSQAIGLKVSGKYTETHEDFEEYFLFGMNDLYQTNHTVHNQGYEDTFITTRKKGYAGVPGTTIAVHCHVCSSKTKKLVPIGNVNLRVGNHGVTSREIQQSWGVEPGTVVIKFKIPLYFEYGVHTLKFKYSGAPGFNPSEKNIMLLVLPKMPTETVFRNTFGTNYTPYDNVLYMDTYQLGKYGEKKYWNKTDSELAKDGYPVENTVVDVWDYNDIPVGWEYEPGKDAGKLELYVTKSLSDKLPTKIRMKVDDNSFSYEQPYLIEDIKLTDKYGRDVSTGTVNMWIDKGNMVVQASTSPDLEFKTYGNWDTLEDHTIYDLVDVNGNIVNRLYGVKYDGAVQVEEDKPVYNLYSVGKDADTGEFLESPSTTHIKRIMIE